MGERALSASFVTEHLGQDQHSHPRQPAESDWSCDRLGFIKEKGQKQLHANCDLITRY